VSHCGCCSTTQTLLAGRSTDCLALLLDIADGHLRTVLACRSAPPLPLLRQVLTCEAFEHDSGWLAFQPEEARALFEAHGVADWDGRSYRQVSALQTWLATQSLSGVSMAGHERVLDVGCGDGRITAAIAEKLPRGSILGIDPSPRMIEVARTLSSARLSFAVDDARTMGYRDEFDAVVSFNALHWVRDQHAVLTRIRTALHDEGWVLIQVVCRGDRPSLESVAMQTCAEPAWRRYFTGFHAPFVHVDPATYGALAARAGLHLTDHEVADRTWDFDTPEDFARWCRVGFGAWTTRLPDDHSAEDFVHAVLTTYAEVTGSHRRFRFLQLRARLRPALPAR
jgi:trans-aconitate 2-methyltransferase